MANLSPDGLPERDPTTEEPEGEGEGAPLRESCEAAERCTVPVADEETASPPDAPAVVRDAAGTTPAISTTTSAPAVARDVADTTTSTSTTTPPQGGADAAGSEQKLEMGVASCAPGTDTASSPLPDRRTRPPPPPTPPAMPQAVPDADPSRPGARGGTVDVPRHPARTTTAMAMTMNPQRPMLLPPKLLRKTPAYTTSAPGRAIRPLPAAARRTVARAASVLYRQILPSAARASADLEQDGDSTEEEDRATDPPSPERTPPPLHDGSLATASAGVRRPREAYDELDEEEEQRPKRRPLQRTYAYWNVFDSEQWR
ncbi:hypothetical protein GGX14DRAFT_577228 [Mycena pura]|uniref:Uncharacterized protein n=1 Tax=Mycena pura TaxID=153505 RepID=A0AAD6US29_9AGAR|nr:hypothetical protein GGX14DRAFT_577228 [Mycena pura]